MPASIHSARRARVIGRWGDDTVLLRLDDGTTVEAPVPKDLTGFWDVGAEVSAEFAGNQLVDWRLAPLSG